jgi:Zn-dependent oligopeptidase
MSDATYIDDILQRVEQLLDALEASDKSSTEFRADCDQLEMYLGNQKKLLAAGAELMDPQKSRVASIVKRLAGLQKRAEIRANIPSGLQKYIAEQSD